MTPMPSGAFRRDTNGLSTVLVRVLLCLAAASLLVTALALGARLAWGLELLTHFRFQYAAAQLALLAALGLARRPRWSAALLVGALVNGASLGPYLPRLGGAGAAAPAGTAVTIVTVNVAFDNREAARLIDIIETESPDVVLVVEFTPDWQARLAPLEKHYPHRHLAPRADAFGLALFSRLPLTASREIALESTPAIDAEILTPAGPLRLLGVHLKPPMRPSWLAERNRQLAALAALSATTPGPLIVAGDFNVTPYSPYFSDWLATTGLRTTTTGRGPSFSWPAFLPVLGIPIDHCVVSEQITVIEHRRLSSFGSDHYPILARLALGGRT